MGDFNRRMNADVAWSAVRPWQWLLIGAFVALFGVTAFLNGHPGPGTWLLVAVYVVVTFALMWSLPRKSDTQPDS